MRIPGRVFLPGVCKANHTLGGVFLAHGIFCRFQDCGGRAGCGFAGPIIHDMHVKRTKVVFTSRYVGDTSAVSGLRAQLQKHPSSPLQGGMGGPPGAPCVELHGSASGRWTPSQGSWADASCCRRAGSGVRPSAGGSPRSRLPNRAPAATAVITSVPTCALISVRRSPGVDSLLHGHPLPVGPSSSPSGGSMFFL